MSDQQLLEAVMRSPAEVKPCTRTGADQVEWLRSAVSRLADRPVAVREEMRARRLCAGCPVRSECLELSLRGEPVEGVQGGTTERSRRTLRHRRAGVAGRLKPPSTNRSGPDHAAAYRRSRERKPAQCAQPGRARCGLPPFIGPRGDVRPPGCLVTITTEGARP